MDCRIKRIGRFNSSIVQPFNVRELKAAPNFDPNDLNGLNDLNVLNSPIIFGG